MRFRGIVLILFAFIFLLFAQDPPQDIHGKEFRDWIKANLYDGKHNSLGYTVAREKMFAFIDNYGDSIEGVYSGYKRFNEYGHEVTYLDKDLQIVIVNTEHTIPQSFFNEKEPMRSDLFHLFPTYANWNSSRGSLPFSDIPDNEVNLWIINQSSQTSTPEGDLSGYSRLKTNISFEPRDVHKGNLARAVFYFYTVYPAEAGDMNLLGSLQTFYNWHLGDPIDTREEERNDRIASYQGNRNPYIDHPEWIVPAWDIETSITDDNGFIPEFYVLAKVYPNPFNPSTVIEITNIRPGKIVVSAFNVLGQRVDHIYSGLPVTRALKLSWRPETLNSGTYFILIRNDYGTKVLKAQYLR